MPKRRRSDSYQHQLERESRQRAAEAALIGNMRDGAPDHLRGNDRRNYLCPVIRPNRGATRLVRRAIRVAERARELGASAAPRFSSIANSFVVVGAWLVRGDKAFAEFSDGTREHYRHLVGLVQYEWYVERMTIVAPARWAQGKEREKKVGWLVAALSGAPPSEYKKSYSYSYAYELRLEEVSRRQAAAANLTGDLRGGAPKHLTGNDRRNHLCPPLRLRKETAMLVRRMLVVAAHARYGYRGDPHTVASMANLLLFSGAWLVFRDEALDDLPPGARESYKSQFEVLRAKRLSIRISV